MNKIQERFVVLAIGVVTLVVAALAFAGTLFGGATEFVQEVTYILAPAFAVIAGISAVLRIGVGGTLGRSILNITLALLLWFTGEVIWEIFEYVLEVDPFPSVADIFYLLAYIPFFIGIYLQIQGEAVREWRSRLLFVTVFATALVAAVSYAGIYLAYDVEATMLENTIAIAYGIGDLLLILLGLLVAVLSIEYRGGRIAIAGWYFFVGLLLTLIADILFAMYVGPYEAGELHYLRIDLLWIAGYLALGYSLYYRGEISSQARKRLPSAQNKKRA